LLFLGDELTLDCFGLADGADIFVWNGKEVKENQISSPLVSSEEISCKFLGIILEASVCFAADVLTFGDTT